MRSQRMGDGCRNVPHCESKMVLQARDKTVKMLLKIFLAIEYRRNVEQSNKIFRLYDFCVLQLQNLLAIIPTLI